MRPCHGHIAFWQFQIIRPLMTPPAPTTLAPPENGPVTGTPSTDLPVPEGAPVVFGPPRLVQQIRAGMEQDHDDHSLVQTLLYRQVGRGQLMQLRVADDEDAGEAIADGFHPGPRVECDPTADEAAAEELLEEEDIIPMRMMLPINNLLCGSRPNRPKERKQTTKLRGNGVHLKNLITLQVRMACEKQPRHGSLKQTPYMS
jgi:hypothetical protein